VVWLDRGKTRRLERGFAEYETWRDDLLEQEERERHKLDRKIAMELDWVRYGVTARRKRNVRRMAQLRALRQERREQKKVLGNVKLVAEEAAVSGAAVIEAKAVSKAYGALSVVRDLSIRILRKDRLGIVGPNGAGKTTLLNLLTGRLNPDEGEVKLGANVVMASLDQSRALLDPKLTLAEVLTGGVGDLVHVGDKTRHVMSYMKDFLFLPQQARTPVDVLSGGERARLLIAKLLATPSNLLVLDEPTNDLDLETLDLLEEMVADYPGTVLAVSHDRDFLDRIATSVLVAEGEGRFIEYAGGYSDMVAQRGSGVTAKSLVKASPGPSAPRERRSAGPKRKLSFSEKHALETLPKTLTALSAKIGTLKSQLSDSSLYARDQKRFLTLTAQLEAAEREMATAEERWLELEMLREELEGS
jgi:ATP-binding cassette subfamily F protein uup